MKEMLGKWNFWALWVGGFAVILAGNCSCGRKDAPRKQKTTDSKAKKIHSASISRKYPNANDRMVYIPLEDGEIEQWSLDGVCQGSFSLPAKDLESAELLWADNGELIWKEDEEDEEEYCRTVVYSTPIRQIKLGEEILFQQTEELFALGEDDSEIWGTAVDGTVGTVYADEKHIIYLSEWTLHVYDRQAGGKPKQCKMEGDGYASIPYYAPGLPAEIIDDKIICHTGRQSGTVAENAYGFWSYSLGKEQWKSIDNRCFSAAAYGADSERKKVYYQIIDDQSLWEYDCRTGKKGELISEKEWKDCYEKNQLTWDDAYYNDSMFLEGDVIYFVKNQDNPQIFSYKLSDSALFYERELTDAVQRSGYCGVSSYHFLSIIEGKLLLYYEDNDEDEKYFICIDMSTYRMKAVTKADSEKIYFAMIGAWEEAGTTGRWKELESKGSDGVKSGRTSLSIQEQIACIASHADVWLETDDTSDLPASYYHYAVTDLDHNGRLEVIASTGVQGSGAFTNSKYYQISADGTDLRRISDSVEGADIVDALKTVYVDAESGSYYYCVGDYMSGGAGNRSAWYGAMILKNGMLTDRIYAGMESVWNAKKTEEEWHYYSYRNGEEREIAPKKFDEDQLADQFFKGFKKKAVNISWFRINGKKGLTEEKIRKKLAKSYEGWASE